MSDIIARGMADQATKKAEGIEQNVVEVSRQLADKVTQSGLTAALTPKADKTYVDTEIGKKIDKNYVDTKVASVASGSPKGTYATLAALQTAFPTGNTNIYLVTADGKWYYWNGSAWTAGGVYQSTGIGDGTVKKISATFFNQSTKNLLRIPEGTVTGNGVTVSTDGSEIVFDGTATTSFYVNLSILEIQSSAIAGWLTPTIIPMSTGQITLSLNYIKGSPSNGNPTLGLRGKSNAAVTTIGTINQASRNVTVTPTEDISFAYMFIASGTLFSKLSMTLQVETGKVATTYDPFYGFNGASIKPKSVSGVTLADKSVDIAKTDFFTKSTKNLVNPLKITDGAFVNYSDGTVNASAIYSYTEPMPVTQNSIYFTNRRCRMIAYFNSSGAYLSGVQNIAANASFAIPTNAATMQVTFYTADLAKGIAQIELGTNPTTPEPYHYLKTYNAPLNNVVDNLLLFLPSEICVAVGRTIELYNKQVSWCGNINNYHFQWVCSVGKNMKRKFSIMGTVPLIGNYPLTLNVYDNSMNLVKTAATTIRVVSNVIASTKEVLQIGDSLTNTTSTAKPIFNEIRSLSGNKINFVGTRGLITGEKHEGRSGWRAADYLTGTSYTYESEGVHPFWDGTRFNWNHYKTTTGINPHIVQIWLGTNSLAVDPTAPANEIKQMVDYIRQDDPNIPISIVFTLYRGNQDGLGNQTGSDGYAVNQGVWEKQEDYKVFVLMERLNTLLSGYSKLYFSPVAHTMDRDNNYGQSVTPVNPRASQTELLPIEATHPQTQGYLQIADTQFSVFAKHYAD